MAKVRAGGNYLLIFMLAAALLSTPAAKAFSQATAARDLSSFADALFREGDYYRAITEYKRLIHHHGETTLAKEASLKIAAAYIEGKRFDAAIPTLEKFRQNYGNDPLALEALFLEGEAWFTSGNHEEALLVFEEAYNKATSEVSKERAYAARGWTLMRLGRWKDSSGAFEGLGEKDQGRYQRLSNELQRGDLLPEKSPSLAGTLSAIIPGAGQLYVGRKRDALVSFLLNGAFIAASAESFRKGDDALGTILLFFEAGWYAGNIYSAAGGAHKYNEKIKGDFTYAMERKYSFGTDGRGSLFGLYNIRF